MGLVIHRTFFTDIKDEKDYKVGSNFFSVNVVKESIANPVVLHDFPRRTKDAALFNVQNGVLSINETLYKNIKKYIKTKSAESLLQYGYAENINLAFLK